MLIRINRPELKHLDETQKQSEEPPTDRTSSPRQVHLRSEKGTAMGKNIS